MKTNPLLRLDRRFWVIILALVLFVTGFSVASYSETAGGTVRVDRVDFVTDEGYKMSAKLYIPDNATVETPAPGILAIPGGNANLENMSDVDIELARRGYVVMAIDPYTIGRSEIVNTPDVGSRAAMDYLMSLNFVDSDCIGAMGHSAGTGRAKWAVTTDPDCTVIRDGVKAVFYLAAGDFNLEGVNMGVFIGSWDNPYGQGKISARDIATAEPFIDQIGANPIELGTWYDMGDGTSRILYTGNSGHPTALMLKEPILDVVSFFEQALAPAPVPADGIGYVAKEVGTSIGIIAVLMMMGQPVTFAKMFPFILMLGITMVAAPGVPGGAVMAALGILQSMLGFDETMQGLMIALYIAQDSFGTACNVTGDGAIAVFMDSITKKGKAKKEKANV